jgi:uncharacterized protein (DUF2235 family)
MPKNVVLCCDGTANEFAEDRTNVVKLFFTLERDPSRQVAYYHPGLGTMEPPGALTSATRISRVLLPGHLVMGSKRISATLTFF